MEMILFSFKGRKMYLILGKIHKYFCVFQTSDALDGLQWAELLTKEH